MESAKTTFYLTLSLRARLKAAAAHHGRSVKQLLAEGAEPVLARYQGVADRHFHRAGKRVRPLLVAERGRLLARLPAD